MNINIVEAYMLYNKQLVIFISGLSGCGKTKIAKKISDNFKIYFQEVINYTKKNYDDTVTLPDGTKIINLYTDDAIDWDKLNKYIDKVKHNGVVISGMSFPKDKIKAHVDYHIHLPISKKNCLDKRRMYLEKHKDKYKDEYETINTPLEKLKMNQLIFPYYKKSVDVDYIVKINKFVSVNNITDKQVWDIVWDILINHKIKQLMN